MTEYEFNLYLSAEKYQQFYSGKVKHVVAQDQQGVTVQFPAAILRPFVTKNGIQGQFVIRMDKNNKFIDIRRVA